MKAILINPALRSLETIDIIGEDTPESIIELHKLIGDDLDFYYFAKGEMIVVGDHGALHDPPLPAFAIGRARLYGRGIVLGHTRNGRTRETKFTVETIWELVSWL